MLLLLPFDKKIEKNRFPIVTILLVLINTVIFFGFQFGDDDKYQKALDYYLESDLPDYEFPLYLQYLKDHNDDDYYYVKKWHDQNKKYTYYFMLSNGVFMKKMLSEELSVGIKEVREKWRKQRDEFEEKLNESVTYKYALIPADHRPVTFLTYQFLHGSTMHLIGNMIFLFVLGFSLEAVYGSIKFTVIYLLCGVGAASFYFVFNAGSMVHMVGASGAIAGFMGLYAVTYGLRQIRFFYNVLFYVDYIKAPALIMLPLWLMNEIIQNVSSNTNVAYTAHIGGILSGAAIGTIFKLLNKGIDEEYLDENINLEEYNKQLDVANGYFNRLDFNRARRCYYQILEQFEAGFDILKKIYSF